MRKKPIQAKIDLFWEKTLFKIIPQNITPNIFSGIRLVLIPFILYYLAIQQFLVAIFLFLVAAICDSIDGSLARQRNKTSEFGKLLDSLADKLLVILIIAFFAFWYPYPLLLVGAIFFDILALLGSALVTVFWKTQKIPDSNTIGKAKMFSAVISIVAVFLFLGFPNVYLLIMTIALLTATSVLGFTSFLVYAIEGFKKAKK